MRPYVSLCFLIAPCVSWVLISFDASLCVIMCPYGSLYVLMSLYSSLLVLIGPDASLWIGMGPYGSLYVLMSFYGS